VRRRLIPPLLFLLGACAHEPSITHPNLPKVGDREAALDCPGLDLSIARTETVRWVLREDGARLLTGSELMARAAVDVVTIVTVWFPIMSYGGHHELNRIDRRLRDLLALKSEKGCDASPTAHPGMTDLELLERLVPLMDRLGNAGDERERLDERTRLLDGLRAFVDPMPMGKHPSGRFIAANSGSSCIVADTPRRSRTATRTGEKRRNE
jgi:hypothetical protein